MGILHDLVIYDGNDRPDGMRCDMLSIYLMKVIENMNERMTRLKKKLMK